MTVRQTERGWATFHCHGKRSGKIIHEFTGPDAKEKAYAQHAAIEASKARVRKGKR